MGGLDTIRLAAATHGDPGTVVAVIIVASLTLAVLILMLGIANLPDDR